MFLTYRLNIDNTIGLLKKVVKKQIQSFISESRKEESKNYKEMIANLQQYTESVEESNSDKKDYYDALKQIEEDSLRQISESKINEGSIEELYGGFNFDNHIQLGKVAQDKYMQSIICQEQFFYQKHQKQFSCINSLTKV